MMVASSKAARYEFLDWLRVIAVFVLLFYHTGMLFVGWDFHIQNAVTIAALELPMTISHRLRMPLLFIVAGAGLWFASRRRTAAGMMKERTLRLLLPVVFGMLLIVPPQIYVERLFRDQWQGGYVAFFFERVLAFRPYPEGDLSWHHLWFIVYLFLYVPLLLPLVTWLRGLQRTISPGPWLYALAAPLGLNEMLLKPLYPRTHALIGDWYVFDHYFLLTGYGVLMASIPGTWDWLARRRTSTLVLALIVTVGIGVLLNHGVLHYDTAAYALFANVFTWFWLLAMLGYARRYLSFENDLLRWARDASYPVYILHQTVMLIVAYWVISQPWGPWLKFMIVLLATMFVSGVLYEAFVRRFATTRFVFGMKPTCGRVEVRTCGRQKDAARVVRPHAPTRLQ